MRPRNTSLTLTLILALMVALASCGKHEKSEKYYLITVNVDIPYWKTAANGFNKAAAELGVWTDVVGPKSYDPQAQRDTFRKVVQSKPSGILVSAAEAKLLTEEINSAINAGIPVITIDSDAPQSRRLFFIGTNNYEAGVMGGEFAAKRMNGRGEVVVFTMPGQRNLDERLNGYRTAFADTQIKIAEVIDIQGDPMVAFNKAREVGGKYKGEVDGYVCLEAIGGKEVADVLERQGAKGKTLVAMDTDDETLEWIRKDMINATIAQKPFTMAYFGLKMLDNLHHNKANLQDATVLHGPFARFPSFVDTGATLIDRSNLEDFIKRRDEAAAGKTGAQ
ncbi:MAG: substrate-binding domain-containing protein [Acidobacteriales bacterium]|nr:substrate-binding domain-containing protein [Terriglobales bacterium]